MCRPYAVHYSYCDGDYLDDSCHRCSPGTDCVGIVQPGPQGTSGVCRKPCTTVDDCPCGDEGELEGTQLCDEGYCYVCVQEGEECNAEVKCCDPDNVCGSAGECCPEIGSSCTVRQDCCQPEHTCIQGDCTPCVENGDFCTDDIECCNNSCKDGRCRANCDPADPPTCLDSSKDGPCKHGTAICDDETWQKVGCSTPSPTIESCNGIDDNCDGTPDNLPTEPCTGEDITSCQPGFTVPTAGHYECVNGTKTCVAEPTIDFCTGCDNSTGSVCGKCGATTCVAGECPPNYYCKDNGPYPDTCEQSPGCNSASPGVWAPRCYLPGDVGTTCCSDTDHECL